MTKTGVVEVGISPSAETGLPSTDVVEGEPVAGQEVAGSVQKVAAVLTTLQEDTDV